MDGSTEFWLSILSDFPLATSVINSDGEIVYTNDIWAKFGRDNGIQNNTDMIGENYLDVCDSASVESATIIARQLRQMIAGDSDNAQYKYPCHSPTQKRWYQMNARMSSFDDQTYVIITHSNITDRVLMENRLNEQNERLQNIARMLAHDIRNPLTVLFGYTDRLPEIFGEHTQLIPQIEDSLERIDEIIGNALSLIDHDTVQNPSNVSLAETAKKGWSNINTEDVELDIESDLEFLAEPSFLCELLENLFRNAIEHKTETVYVGRLGEGFYVEDTGEGIPEDAQNDVFESGFTTKNTGTGFGLSIVQQICEAHEWTVRVTTGRTGGARFEIQTDDSADSCQCDESCCTETS